MIKISSLLKWSILCLLVAFVAGSTSALFLILLDWITDLRNNNTWLIVFLPIAGLFTVLLYQNIGKKSARGNRLIYESIKQPTKPILDWLLAPLIFITTLVAHLFGASVGREGTALQLSAGLSDQLTKPFKLSPSERIILLKAAVAAGFAAVFGTPLAGVFFALEFTGKPIAYHRSLIPTFISAFLADQCTLWWGIKHSFFSITKIPSLTFINSVYLLIAAIAFGIIAFIFKRSSELTTKMVTKLFPNELWRAVLGGSFITTIVFSGQLFDFIGLGVPSILNAFSLTASPTDFILKMLLTILSISIGFKGGEVTPLFFIGATLGSILSIILPLPISFLAGMGMIALFGSATKTPISAAFLAYELFGKEYLIYAFIICIIASFISGKKSIYQPE
ncbi:chloride channel protein [Sediminibacterium sp.]|uniref:chloride channel protein n=1 Tax=Sediminibacterium sp. TaxID=1917865 RepID=UPI003F72E83A